MLKDLIQEAHKLCESVTNTELAIKFLAESVEDLERKVETLETEIDQIETVDNSNQLISMAATVGKLTRDVSSLQVLLEAAKLQPSWLPPYHFALNPHDPDNSWDSIIKKGQEIQEEVYHSGERYWQGLQGDSPSGRGWYGTVSMPVITIVCTEPEYRFHSTKRLPGRFRLWSPARWGSTLRFYGDVGPTIHDNWTNEAGTPYGFKTDAPIGIYVEPTTDVSDTFRVRPFEQSIENCLIVAHNGVLPIYLADNQDRFCIRDCNIQQHQGATVGIKHGPPIKTGIIKQAPMANVYLADPKFIDLQMEGPFKMDRPQAAIFCAGNNVHMRGLNLYGWLQGPYLHGGKNRYVQVQVHKSNTHDGRTPLKLDEVCGATLNKYLTGENVECVGAEVNAFPPEASVAHETCGTHKRGDGLFGG